MSVSVRQHKFGRQAHGETDYYGESSFGDAYSNDYAGHLENVSDEEDGGSEDEGSEGEDEEEYNEYEDNRAVVGMASLNLKDK